MIDLGLKQLFVYRVRGIRRLAVRMECGALVTLYPLGASQRWHVRGEGAPADTYATAYATAVPCWLKAAA